MLIQHGKVTFVLGLEWIEIEGGSVIQELREHVGKNGVAFYQALGSSREGLRAGFVREVPEIDEKKSRRKAYSLAAAVAMQNRDGIFFLEVGADQGWYAVIQGGQLMRGGGEMLMPRAHAIDAVEKLAQSLELRIHATHPYFPDAAPFALSDLDSSLRRLKPMQALKPGSGASPLVGVAVLACVLGGIGFTGWKMFAPAKPKVSAAQLAQQARDEYAQTMLGVLPTLDSDPAWILDAYRDVSEAFPALVHGWVLTDMVCAPMQCGATYAISEKHSTFSLRGLRDRFGPRVSLAEDMRKARVVVERPASLLAWDVDTVLDPKPATAELPDVHGLLRIRLPQVKIEETMHRESLAQGTRPPDVPGIVREMILTSGRSAYPAPAFGRMAEAMGPFGFTPETMEVVPGVDGEEPAWRVTWVRISRDGA